MLFRVLSALLKEQEKEPEHNKKGKKPTQKEKDKRDYDLWVAAEEDQEEEG